MRGVFTIALGVAVLIAGLNAERLPLSEGQDGAMMICGGGLIVLGFLNLAMGRLMSDERREPRPR